MIKKASFVVELADENAYDGVVLGKTNDNGVFIIDGDVQTVDELIDAWCGKLEKVFATDSGKKANMPYDVPLYKERSIFVAKNKVQSQRYLFLHSRALTARLTLQEHLKKPALKQTFLL